MSKNISKLYVSIYKLKKRKNNLLNELRSIEQKRSDIFMEYAILESDLIQSIGFSQKEFRDKQERLFKEQTILDNKEHDIGYEISLIKRELSEIIADLSS